MTNEEKKPNGCNIEILPCKRMDCKGTASCVLNIKTYMNVYDFEEQVMKYMCNMRPVMDEFICVDLAGIVDRPVDFIQSLVESYIRYDGVHIKKNYRVEYGALDKAGENHIYLLEAPNGACDYDMAVSVFAMVCIEGKAPTDWHWKEITEEAFAQDEQAQYRNPISKKTKIERPKIDREDDLERDDSGNVRADRRPVHWPKRRGQAIVLCPKCGSKNIADIYHKKEHFTYLDFGEAFVGEELSDYDPRYRCKECECYFGYNNRNRAENPNLIRRVLGAVVGDIVGSVYEFNEIKTKNFPLFSKHCFPTDDSIMTLAVMSALVECDKDYSKLAEATIKQMQLWGKKYPKAGYGSMFSDWLRADNPLPYNSFGNGSAMRVSPVVYFAKSLEEVKELSRIVTSVTHNHPEGIKGAEAAAVAAYMALHESKKEEILAVIDAEYYPMNFTLDEIRADYEFNETCQETVPQALKAFFEATSFEDAIRNAVSIGGDSDTIAAITGTVAGAYYGVPLQIEHAALAYLDECQLSAYYRFVKYLCGYAELYEECYDGKNGNSENNVVVSCVLGIGDEASEENN